jgi:hypothetical protein
VHGQSHHRPPEEARVSSFPDLPPASEAGSEAAPEAAAEPAAAGADRFAAQRAALAGLDGRPLDEHADVFAEVHAAMQASLAEIDGI